MPSFSVSRIPSLHPPLEKVLAFGQMKGAAARRTRSFHWGMRTTSNFLPESGLPAGSTRWTRTVGRGSMGIRTAPERNAVRGKIPVFKAPPSGRTRTANNGAVGREKRNSPPPPETASWGGARGSLLAKGPHPGGAQRTPKIQTLVLRAQGFPPRPWTRKIRDSFPFFRTTTAGPDHFPSFRSILLEQYPGAEKKRRTGWVLPGRRRENFPSLPVSPEERSFRPAPQA